MDTGKTKLKNKTSVGRTVIDAPDNNFCVYDARCVVWFSGDVRIGIWQ
jgi:hypothetical protein